MTRTSKNLSLFILCFALLWLFLWARTAFADGLAPPDPTQTPGSLVDYGIQALRIGAYGVVTLVLLEGAALGLLAWARRPGSRLSPYVKWLSAAAAIIGTALLSVAASGERGLQAVPVALLTALIAYYVPSANKPPQSPTRDPQAGHITVEKMIGIGLVLIGFSMLMVLVAGCGPIRKAGDATKTAAIDCAKLDIVAHIPDVTKILEDGGATWKQQAEDLGVQIGEDELACTVRSVIAVLEQTQTNATPDHNAVISTPEARALINGRTLIDEHGWSFAGAPLSMHEGRKAGAIVRVERQHVVQVATIMHGWGW